MKRIKLLVVILLLMLSVIMVKETFAYGFGYKKNANHIQPDIGIYKSILDKNNAIYVGDKNEKVVYLTFDCGYENGYTTMILDVLKEENINATFFITGHYVTSASDIVLRMKNDGHVVANHTNKHKNITTISKEEIIKEIKDLETMYYNLTSSNLTKFYRPPAGNFDDKSLSVVNELGYKTMFWSLAYPDWNHNNSVDYTVKEVMSNIHSGAIILMHAVSKSNAMALKGIITELINQGYTISSTLNLIK